MADNQWPVRQVPLSPPPLEELASAIRDGIRSSFSVSEVHVSTPPDLREAPFCLAGPGLSGNARVADVGGTSNLFPSPNLDAKYDLLQISSLMEMNPEAGLLIGAGAGPFHLLGLNTELMPNLAFGSLSDGQLQNRTHYAKILDDGTVHCDRIGESTGFGLMCNLLGCDGETGPLIHVKAKGRTGKKNFTEAIQAALGAVYGEKLVSLGGAFVIHAGKTKMHVMPDFPSKPFEKPTDVETWLQFFDTDAPLTCLSVFHSGNDQGLGLRMEHTHCFAAGGPNKEKRGGHYHFDLDETKEDIEYEGWFNAAETLYRIDPKAARP